MKDRGGLKRPSKSCILLCTEAEKCFERMLKVTGGQIPTGTKMSHTIATAVLETTSSKTLFPELAEHQYDTTADDNHVHKLSKSVVSKYIMIRMCHLAKQLTDKLRGPSAIGHLRKTVQFLHQ